MHEANQVKNFIFGEHSLKLQVPDEHLVREQYHSSPGSTDKPVFPYWAKLWPASEALSDYLHANPQLIKNKIVLELAAGLGLPSIYAALHAKKVISSDYAPAALDLINESANLNGFSNLECRLIDWHHYPTELQADVVLMSDVNYEPAQFEVLHNLITTLVHKGSTIILSTPQRIMAKPFVELLLPYSVENETVCIKAGDEATDIFIMRLQSPR